MHTLLSGLKKVAGGRSSSCGVLPYLAGLCLQLHSRAAKCRPDAHLQPPCEGCPATTAAANVLDGRKVAQQWTAELEQQVAVVTQALGRPPGLGVLLVGSRPDSVLYVTRKQEACSKVGINAHVVHLPADTTQDALEAAVSDLCQSSTVDGVLVQLPLPKHLDEEAAMDHLDPRKDVDGFHPLNMGRILMRGRSGRFVPCTPLGCLELLERSGIAVQGKTAVILGDSNIVGTPLASLLRDRGAAAVTVCHRMSYHELYETDDWVMAKRSVAAACLPRLPGPGLKRLAVQTGSKFYTDHINHAAARTTPDSSQGGSSTNAAEELQPCFHAHQLPELTRTADILVVAVGHPELVRAHWVKPGAVVLDVGINVVPNTHTPSTPSDKASDKASESPTTYNLFQQQPSPSQSHPSLLSPPQPPPHMPSTPLSDLPANIHSNSPSHPPLKPTTYRSSPSPSHAPRHDHCNAPGSPSFHPIAESSQQHDTTPGANMTHSPSPVQPSVVQPDGPANHCSAPEQGEAQHSSGCAPPHESCPPMHILGDVAFDEVAQIASAVSPVPGGIGPMTIAGVLHNTLQAAKYRLGMEKW